MDVTAVLGNLYVKVGVIPLAGVLLTVFVRRTALRTGRVRPSLMSAESLNVGFDLYVLAMVTALTSAIDKLVEVNRLNEAVFDETRPAPGYELKELAPRVDALYEASATSACVVLLAVLAAWVTADWVRDKGYNPVQSPGRGNRAQEPGLTRRGVLVPLGGGLLLFLAALSLT